MPTQAATSSAKPKHPVLLPGPLSLDQQCVAVLIYAASVVRVPGRRVVVESAAAKYRPVRRNVVRTQWCLRRYWLPMCLGRREDPPVGC